MSIADSPRSSIDLTVIPQGMRDRPQWVDWIFDQRGDGKPTKIPVTIGGYGAKTNDPADWYDISDALEAMHKFDGIGYVFNERCPFLGGDLDDCFASPGELKPWAAKIMDQFAGTYSELSPSGNGIKFFCRAKNPMDRGRKIIVGDNDGAIEIYDRLRFFTVTTNVWDDSDATDKQAEVDALVDQYFSRTKPKPITPGPSNTGAISPSPTDRVELASSELATMAPTQCGTASCHDNTFSAACLMVLGFDLDVETAFRLLWTEYVPRGTHPWTEQEIRHKVDSANGRPGERGYMLTGRASAREQHPDVDLSVFMANIPEVENEPAEPSAAAGPEPYFKPITAAELDAGDFSINYLIPGILCEKQPLIVAGQSKSLKTTLLLDAAISLASGTKFLNRFNAECRRVFVLTAESGMGTVQETCRRICRSRGRLLANIENIIFADKVPQFTNASHMAELARLLKDRGTEVLIIDPAYLCLDGSDAGNLFLMGSQLRLLAELAAEANCTPILIHHAKKSAGNAIEYQPLELQDIAWAGFSEFARQWLLLSRRERYTEGTGEHRLWMTAGGSAGHSGCWAVDIEEGNPMDDGGRIWDVNVSEAQQARSDAAERKAAAKKQAADEKLQKHVQVLRDAFIGIGHAGQSKSAAFERAGLNPANGMSAMGALLREGVVEPCEVKAGNRTVAGYRLTTREQEKDEKQNTPSELFGKQTDQADKADNSDNF